MRYQNNFEPWVSELISSYHGSVASVRQLQVHVRQRCMALKRMSGEPLRLRRENLLTLQQTMSEVRQQASLWPSDQAAVIMRDLTALQEELDRAWRELAGGHEELVLSSSMLTAVRRVQKVLRGARGLLDEGNLQAAHPTRFGEHAGRATDAFPECALCPLRNKCPLADLKTLNEALSDLMHGLDWLQTRYGPIDSANAFGRKRSFEELMGPVDMAFLMEGLGRSVASAEDAVVSVEDEQRLEFELRTHVGLTEHQWRAVQLCYLQGYSLVDAGELLGCSASSVSRALAAVVRKYEAYAANLPVDRRRWRKALSISGRGTSADGKTGLGQLPSA